MNAPGCLIYSGLKPFELNVARVNSVKFADDLEGADSRQGLSQNLLRPDQPVPYSHVMRAPDGA